MQTRRKSALARLWLQVVAVLRKVRTLALAAGLVAALAALAFLSWRAYEVRRDNAAIAALKAGDDVAVDPRNASGELILARTRYLHERDRRAEAQELVDASSSAVSDPALRAKILYNHANARVQDAIAAVRHGDLDRAIPLTRLAKDEYRQALRLDPGSWDIKYNYDIAMRIVRDFPGAESDEEEVPPDAPKRLWTDLPGVPKGLP